MTYTVYLSSTLNDLVDEREAVKQALSDECVVKHSYLASEKELIASCLDDVGRCDAYKLNFKFYRQATDKIVGVPAATPAFLDGCCRP